MCYFDESSVTSTLVPHSAPNLEIASLFYGNQILIDKDRCVILEKVVDSKHATTTNTTVTMPTELEEVGTAIHLLYQRF